MVRPFVFFVAVLYGLMIPVVNIGGIVVTKGELFNEENKISLTRVQTRRQVGVVLVKAGLAVKVEIQGVVL